MPFPTIYSTLDPIALGHFVSGQYRLDKCSCRLLLRGVGDSYLIQAPLQRYILRVYRNTHRTLEHIQAEVELLTRLRRAGISISYPIADVAGNFIQPLDAAEGARYAVLFSFAPGKTPSILNDDQLKSLGREIARFHEVSSDPSLKLSRWQFDESTTLTQPIERARANFASIPDELTWWLHVAEKARRERHSFASLKFSEGYCHYDFLSKNFHFDDTNVTFFDFDFFGYGWLVNDIMTFWTQLELDAHLNRITKSQCERSFMIMLEAYREVRNMTADEIRAIPTLQVGWWCFYMGFHASHDQFMNFVEPGHLKMRTALIRQLVDTTYNYFS